MVQNTNTGRHITGNPRPTMLYIGVMKLRPKTKAFADKLLTDPKISQTQAWLATHNTTNAASAAVSATQILSKPNVQIYMQEHIDKAKQRVVTLVDSDKEDIALRASDSILDRALGKATQRTEVQTTGVTLTIDLTNSIPDQQG